MVDNQHLHGLDSPERNRERREAERLKIEFRLSVSTEHSGGLTVTPASVRDISLAGALVVSRQRLTPFQNVMVAIPTGECPEGMGLPEAFVGPAMVVRVHKSDETKNLIALKFGESLSGNDQFMGFVRFLGCGAGDSRTTTD
ncbi:MAG TPA: PilZ domain-containing protein [Candidatus Bathyarchaeia archaeon]|nr:PilZ domain-containing protein [Candidatus Bathyarchaeia archaeon]